MSGGFILQHPSDKLPDARELGTVTIAYNSLGEVTITSEGFDIDGAFSSRKPCFHGKIWAKRTVFEIKIDSSQRAPGSVTVSCST